MRITFIVAAGREIIGTWDAFTCETVAGENSVGEMPLDADVGPGAGPDNPA